MTGNGEELGAVQVAVHRAVPRLVGGDVSRFLDRQLGVRSGRGGHCRSHAFGIALACELRDHGGGAPVGGELQLGSEAERAESLRNVLDRGPRYGRTR